jgi:DNA uptake protein ComE-like DNA-binding protein
MANRIRVNTADVRQLLELPGVGLDQVERIVKFRRVYGPIVNESELSRVLGWRALGESLWDRVDFTAREEIPGA